MVLPSTSCLWSWFLCYYVYLWLPWAKYTQKEMIIRKNFHRNSNQRIHRVSEHHCDFLSIRMLRTVIPPSICLCCCFSEYFLLAGNMQALQILCLYIPFNFVTVFIKQDYEILNNVSHLFFIQIVTVWKLRKLSR